MRSVELEYKKNFREFFASKYTLFERKKQYTFFRSFNMHLFLKILLYPFIFTWNAINFHVSICENIRYKIILVINFQEWTIKFVPEFSRVGQLRPSIIYAKYLLSPWICQTSIKKVPPSKCSVRHTDMSPCMLCCLVHVARRKPRVQGLIWLNWKRLSFNFSVYFFLLFPFCLCITHTSFFTFQNIKNVLDPSSSR